MVNLKTVIECQFLPLLDPSPDGIDCQFLVVETVSCWPPFPEKRGRLGAPPRESRLNVFYWEFQAIKRARWLKSPIARKYNLIIDPNGLG